MAGKTHSIIIANPTTREIRESKIAGEWLEGGRGEESFGGEESGGGEDGGTEDGRQGSER